MSDETLALIKERLPAEKASMLIRVRESVIASALNALDDTELALVGATRCHAHDVVVAQPTGGDSEARAAALLLSVGRSRKCMPRPTPRG